MKNFIFGIILGSMLHSFIFDIGRYIETQIYKVLNISSYVERSK